jgi:hypothetical protein
MNRTLRWLVGGVAVLAGIWLLSGRSDAVLGGDKDPWQPILTKEIYQELAKREAEVIKTSLAGSPDEDAIRRARLGATLIAALTLSGNDKDSAEKLRGVRERAIVLAHLLTDKTKVAEARKLLDGLLDTPSPDKKMKVDWDKLLTSADLMDHFRTKKMGGDGIHPDLQSNIKLKGALNGIEEKLRGLGMKELTAEGMKKEAKELELLAYRIAVTGALTYVYPPPKDAKRNPDDWRLYSLKTRDTAVELATAAKKGDTAAVYKAAGNLGSACSQCHGQFRATVP